VGAGIITDSPIAAGVDMIRHATSLCAWVVRCEVRAAEIDYPIRCVAHPVMSTATSFARSSSPFFKAV
jgi:hypothetical protein